jgi:hypothetical protein
LEELNTNHDTFLQNMAKLKAAEASGSSTEISRAKATEKELRAVNQRLCKEIEWLARKDTVIPE